MHEGRKLPSVEDLYRLISRQAERIEALEGRIGTAGGVDDPNTRGEREEPGVASAAAEPGPEPDGRTRGGFLRSAALGAAGVATTALVLNPSSAEADAGPVTFTSNGTDPTVTAANSGSGRGLLARSNTGTGIVGTTDSAASGAIGVQGQVLPTSPGTNSSGIRGTNLGTGTKGIGVYGSQNGGGQGVYGTTPSGTGVAGQSASGTGITGTSDSGTGASATSNSGIALEAQSTSNTAIQATSGDTAEFATAIVGTISSATPGGFSSGVYGVNSGTDANGVGVYGTQGGSGLGVYGTCPRGVGVDGESISGTGVEGTSISGTAVYASSDGGTGVYAESSSTAADAAAISAAINPGTQAAATSAVHASNADTGQTGIGVFGQQAGDGYGVWGEADGSQGYGVYGTSASGYGVYGASPTFALYGKGNIGATGTKSAVVGFADGKQRKFYCVESPECWFEDFGSASLNNGAATVNLDPKFAEAVNTDRYHVFLTAEGNCHGLFVTNMSSGSFEVRELAGGSSGVQFSYRVVALRADVDAPRLQLVPSVQKTPRAPKKLAAPTPAHQGRSRARP